jgi:uncharacterized membrane protein
MGQIEALVRLAPLLVGRRVAGRRREVRIQFRGWLLLGLEFELAADIIRTAIALSWTDIGQLAAIALIRTALYSVLESDIDALKKRDESPVPETRGVLIPPLSRGDTYNGTK